MSGSSGGSGDHSLDTRGYIPAELRNALQLYFTKDEAKTLVMKVTALNHSLDYIKVGLAGLAVGLTVVKTDFTLFKVDEKGISWAGNTLKTWPWADPGKKAWRTIMPKRFVEDYDRKKAKEEEEKLRREEEKRELRTYVDQTFYKASRAKDLHLGIRRAKDAAAHAQHDVDTLRTKLSEIGRGNTPKANPKLNATKNVQDLRASVVSLSRALADI